MRNKELRKSLLCLFLMIVMLSLTLPTPVMAASGPKYVSAGTLAPDTSIRPKEMNWDTNTVYCYRISIPATGYIRLTSATQDRSIFLLPALSKCQGKDLYNCSLFESSFYNSRYEYIPVTKGTYYICSPYSAAKIRYTFKKVVPLTNYCSAKAKSLSAGKKVTICFNKGYLYDRWYKIKLTSKKTITITLKQLSGSAYSSSDFTVYNASGQKINCPLLDGSTYRTAKQKAGTYYIRVHTPWDGYAYPYNNGVYTISWK